MVSLLIPELVQYKKILIKEFHMIETLEKLHIGFGLRGLETDLEATFGRSWSFLRLGLRKSKFSLGLYLIYAIHVTEFVEEIALQDSFEKKL